MKTLATIALTLAMISAASAQQTTFRDDHGRTTGTAATTGNMTTYRDERGRTVGTGTTNGGTTTFRDSNGRTTGTATAPIDLPTLDVYPRHQRK
jgi:uncharacterized membrane protein YoaK (UPF0700 family)